MKNRQRLARAPRHAMATARPHLRAAAARRPLLVIVFALSAGPIASADAANIVANSFAWSENAGWINFAPNAGPGVAVGDMTISGYAWAENLGWINFSPSAGGVFNNPEGVLSGFAWSENAGWINFAPLGGGVEIDTITGAFSGFAWGENIGWINFNAPTNVVTTWRPSDRIFANGFN
jgi:hypothetical protein